MRILHVIHTVNPQSGGTIEGIRQLSTAILKLGVTVDVLSLDAPDSPWVRDFPLPLFALGSGRPGYGYTPKAVPWLIKHGPEYDMVLANGLWQFGSLAVWLASRKVGFRYAVIPHGMLDPWFKRRYPLKHLKKWLYWPWAEYRVLRDAEGVFFTSEDERLEARKSFPSLYQCREKLMGYGIAPPPPDEARQRAAFLQQYPHLAGKRLILFLGRIHEKKGCDLLLHALRELLNSDQDSLSDLHLVMAGPSHDSFGKRMKLLARQLGLEARVTWTGMLTGDLKWGAFRTADVFILPSHQENFGIAVAEALANRLPVLISDKVNIWREISSDNAGLIETDDLPGTIRLLQRWFALDAAKKDSLRENALECFNTRFHIATVAHAFVSVLSPVDSSD